MPFSLHLTNNSSTALQSQINKKFENFCDFARSLITFEIRNAIQAWLYIYIYNISINLCYIRVIILQLEIRNKKKLIWINLSLQLITYRWISSFIYLSIKHTLIYNYYNIDKKNISYCIKKLRIKTKRQTWLYQNIPLLWKTCRLYKLAAVNLYISFLSSHLAYFLVSLIFDSCAIKSDVIPHCLHTTHTFQVCP